MKKSVIIILQIILFCFPWFLRRLVLNNLLGFEISKKAKIGNSIILANTFIMEEHAFITHFNFVNTIDCLHMKPHSGISKSNWITGANSNASMFSDSKRRCELIIGEHTRVTGQHHIDCTGGVYIGKYTTIAGIRSQILSHSVDVELSKQVAGPVNIGDYCFVGTSCIILMGSKLPDYCVLGAGAILNKKHEKSHSLYAGNPAKVIKGLDENNFEYFKRNHGHVT